MDVQILLALDAVEARQAGLRSFLAPLGLRPREVSLLLWFTDCGEAVSAGDQKLARVSLPKRRAAAAVARSLGISFSANTFMAAVVDLESRGLVGVLRNTSPWTYVVNWTAVSRLQPIEVAEDPAALLALFPGQPAVLAGSGGPCPLQEQGSNPPVAAAPCHVGDSGPPAGWETASWWRFPWAREGGMSDAVLRSAVLAGDLVPLRRLWDQAKATDVVSRSPSEDQTLRFLTLCHHAAVTEGLHCRMAVLKAAVRRDLDVSKCRHASEDWASAVLRRRRSDEFEASLR